MTDFIQKVTPEKKKIRELKFKIYTHGSQKEIKGGWAFIVLDKFEQKSTFSGSERFINKNRIEMISIIEALNWIYNYVEVKYRKYIKVTVYTENVYCVNIINEWLKLWKDSLNDRPNSDLLQTLVELKEKMDIKVEWCGKTHSEYMWATQRIANDRINED